MPPALIPTFSPRWEKRYIRTYWHSYSKNRTLLKSFLKRPQKLLNKGLKKTLFLRRNRWYWTPNRSNIWEPSQYMIRGLSIRSYKLSLQRTFCHFDEIVITGCTGSCENDNFECNQWWNFHQNDDKSILVNCPSYCVMICSCRFKIRRTSRQLNHISHPSENSTQSSLTLWDLMVRGPCVVLIFSPGYVYSTR